MGIALVSTTVLLATTASLANPPENYQIKFNVADQAVARAAVLRRSDVSSLFSLFGMPGELDGGMERPVLTSDPYAPTACRTRKSDLVLTGAAASGFYKIVWPAAVFIRSQVQRFQSPHMARLDWQRKVLGPGLNACMRHELLQLAEMAGWQAKLKSFKRFVYPKTIRYPASFVAVYKRTLPPLTTTSFAAEGVSIQYKGRTQIVVRAEASLPSAKIAAAEVISALHELNPILIGRARA